ncbi:MAG TPA: hypothetical protein VJ987_14990 [Anaerolineales bacterium]|nr:hypothetical protein [Anaerolineales bacterium]
MDEMINALTKGIGVELYKPIRIAYYNKKSFLEKSESYKQCSNEMKLFLLDVLALSIFNQQVITPIHGARNFASGTRKYGVTRVRMASYHLDKEFYSDADRITKQFFAITKEYGLSVEHLHVSSINEFVEFWLKIRSGRDG